MYAMYLYKVFLFLHFSAISFGIHKYCNPNSGPRCFSCYVKNLLKRSTVPPLPSISSFPTNPSTGNIDKTSTEENSNTKQLLATKHDLSTDLSIPEIPLPRQSFYTIRTNKEKYIFVDKTKYIKELIDNNEIKTEYKIYFLSRPRSFGKTFFLSMVYEFLNGTKELFENTDIYSRGNMIEGNGMWIKNPVIYIDFSSFTTKDFRGFEKEYNEELIMIAKKFSVPIVDSHHSFIRWLIRNLKSKYTNSKVSILMDEFDSSLECMNRNTQKKMMMFLKIFYKEIMAAADHSELWLVLIFGVTKLNIINNAMNGMVNDITFEEKFSSMIGFTANETQNNFKYHLSKFAKENMWNINDTMPKINNLYGGYHFTVEKGAPLLNAGSVCSCLRKLEIMDFMPKTQTLSDIVEQMTKEKTNIDNFKYLCIKKYELQQKFHTLNTKVIPLYIQMLCAGFLTIKLHRRKNQEVCLSYPNEAIQNSIECALPLKLRSKKKHAPYNLNFKELMQRALNESDMDFFVELMIEGAFPELSPTLKCNVKKGQEEFDATKDMYKLLHLLSFDCKESHKLTDTKDANDCGDLDIIIFSSEKNMPHYVIENKFNTHPHKAIFQLFGYVVKKNIEFERVFNDKKSETNIINLIGLETTKNKDRQTTLGMWILVPYSIKEKKIIINQARASHPKILLNLSERLKDQSSFKENPDYFIL